MNKTDQWTTRRLLTWMTERFEANEIDSPRLLAEMLLTEVFGGQRIDLYMQIDRIATEDQLGTLRDFVKRAIDFEPVQYIVGNAWFFGHEFEVNASTLIPRSCTEVLVLQALEYCKKMELQSPQIADIGTGSGCIGITIANQMPQASITATDIEQTAIQLAKQNAARLGVESQMTFLVGDGFAPVQDCRFDVICSNPPYIPTHELETLAPNVRNWEPEAALSGGDDGLNLIRPLIQNAHQYLNSNGCLLVEIASSIKDEVLKLATHEETLRDAKILRDQHGDNRFLRAFLS